MIKNLCKYVVTVGDGPRNHFYDPETAAEMLCAIAEDSIIDREKLYKGLVAVLSDMKIGDSKEMGLIRIDCVKN